MLYHAGPNSLAFFAKCVKIIADSDLQMQNYKIEVQLKPKLHQLWRITQWLGKLQLSVFLNVVWVWTVLLLPLCDQIACYVRRPKSRCQSDLSTVSVLAIRSFHQDLMHSGCRGMAVPNVSLQAFSLFPLPSSPLDQRPVHRLYQTQISTFSTLVFRPGVGRNYVIITGHCRYLQLVISLARVCNNGSLFQSNDYNLFLPGI